MTSPTFTRRALLLIFAATILASCSRRDPASAANVSTNASRPSILLITLDTTRADSIGPDATGIETPSFNAVAARGKRFRQAYAPAPQTLPSHSSMMTGLYPAGHGVHENARQLAPHFPLVSEKLREAGYTTAAFVSAFPLARRFGLARGFDLYDDELPAGSEERSAAATTERALAYIQNDRDKPLFLWVHYFDPHYPYAPPEAYRERFAADPYRGEVAAMDEQLGRLVDEFERHVSGPKAIIIAGDHGEGLGEHGESQHGNLVYQATMHVPLVIAGPGVTSGVSHEPVSIRRVFHTILDWAGLARENSLRTTESEVVMGEAMIPFLQYGWQPQVMAIDGRQKVVHAGELEVYDIVADPGERQNLAGRAAISRGARKALIEYPIPSPAAAPPANLTDEDRRRLASLGYIAAEAKPVVRKNAPAPKEMVHLFDELDQASALFASGEYARAVPVLEQILSQDRHNLVVALRIAVAHSALGNEERAEAAFDRAESISPGSPDLRHYLALHYARTGNWQRAVPILERIVAEEPSRLPALEALAGIRERQRRIPEAVALRQKIYSLRAPTAVELIRLGELAMRVGETGVALDAFERARAQQGSAFAHDLELGVLYLATRRYDDARLALDRVPASHPAYPMALFKRAQVSVLLREPESAIRIEAARRHADATTRTLIADEQLFR